MYLFYGESFTMKSYIYKYTPEPPLEDNQTLISCDGYNALVLEKGEKAITIHRLFWCRDTRFKDNKGRWAIAPYGQITYKDVPAVIKYLQELPNE